MPPPRRPAPAPGNRTLLVVLAAVGAVCVGCVGALGAVYWFVVKPVFDKAAEVVRVDPPPPPEPAAKPAAAPTKKAAPAPPAKADPPPPPPDGSARERALRLASIDAVIDRAPELKGKWVAVAARVEKVEPLKGLVPVELVHNRDQHVSATFKEENWTPKDVGVDDELDLIGQVSGATPRFVSLWDCTVARHTPAAPPTPVVIPAADLIAAFDADPAAATARFRGKTVKVTGETRGSFGERGVTTGLRIYGANRRHDLKVVFAADQLQALQSFKGINTLTAVGRLGNRPARGTEIEVLNARFDPPRTGPPLVIPPPEPGKVSDQAKRTIAERHVRENGGHLDYEGPEGKRVVTGVRFFSNVRDHELAHVAAFKELKEIHVLGTEITDGVIPSLKGLTELRYLGLLTPKVGDPGLKHLAGFPKLEKLNLMGTAVTDAGMKDVARVPMLKDLLLRSTAVGDAGLKELEAAKGLTRIDLALTRVTDAGVRSFQAAVPGCKVER